MAQATINNGDSGLTARTAINANFTELYSGKITYANGLRFGNMTSTATSAEPSLYIGTDSGTDTAYTVSRLANVAIGYRALKSVTDGAIFYDGAYNVAVGNNALRLNTTGGYNVAIGYNAMELGQTVIQNTAVGWHALRAKTSGGGSTAYGYQALAAETSGGENTAIGRTCMGVLTTGARNVGIGPCLQALTTGNYNVCAGSENFERVTTQTGNTGIGHNAGVYNRGQQNTAIGYFSLGQLTTDAAGNNASYNTTLGSISGRWVVTGDYNTYLGYDSGTSGVGEVYNYAIAIGANAKVTASYSCVFGSSTENQRANWGFGGESYGSGRGVMFIKNAYVNATTAPTEGIILHSRDSSDLNATIAFYTEQDVEDVGTFTPTKKLKFWHNNIEYWMQLDPV